MPNIKAIFEMFDPMTVPSDKAALSLKIPETPMKISGAEVPNATRVNPMIKSLTPILLAMIDDWATNLSAPQIRIDSPKQRIRKLCSNNI